ncbi:MAG: glycosyltransferase [Pseudomonadota bacterium]
MGAFVRRFPPQIPRSDIVILVTVGMQLGFDRLVKAMDRIAPTLDQNVIVQSGHGQYRAQNMAQHGSLEPSEFEDLMMKADLIVSHAGIGTILAAARASKPIVLFPRRAALGEHRNDHQLATCKQLQGRVGIIAAFEEADLSPAIAQGMKGSGAHRVQQHSTDRLTEAIRGFINTGQL